MYKVMLVDDEKWVRTALRHTIAMTGLPYEVVQECSNGLEAIEALKGQKPDLVLTDVRMPVMDGLSLVSQLSEQDSGPDVIMISGFDEFKYIQHALRTGVTDYLLKPVEPEDLKTCLEKWEKRRLKQEQSSLQAAAPIPVENDLEKSPVERVIGFIRSKMPGEVTLTEAAAHVCLNPSYLSKLFKEKTDKNFSDFVLETRIGEAKMLLEKTSLRISEIAERLQFSDITYFSSAFKRLTGKTASEYRKERT